MYSDKISVLENKYSNLTFLARWKTIIIEYGLRLPADDIFTSYPQIRLYKTKLARLIPHVENFCYIDKSTDETLIPSELIISGKNNEKSLVKVNFNESSPLTLDLIDDQLIIKKDGKIVSLNISLVEKKKYARERIPKEIIENEPFLEDFVQVVGQDRLGILAYEGCWHWNTSKACLFCDANPKRENFDTAMPSLNTLKDVNLNETEWWKKYGKQYLDGIEYTFNYIITHEKIEPHRHLQLMAGNLSHIENVWEICRQIAQRLNKIQPISSFDSYLNIGAPKDNVEQYLELAKNEMGFNQISFNLEVIGEDKFKEVCPGKSATIGYSNFIKALEKAVDIFGFGKVRSNFVLGAQPIEDLLSGIRSLADKGIVADYSVFTPKKGTPWENKASPSMQEVIDFSLSLAEIYKKHGFKGIYCGLSSRSSVLNEILENL